MHDPAPTTVDPRQADPRAPMTVVIGVVSFVLVVVVVLLLEALYHRTVQAEEYRKVISVPAVELERIRAEQGELLENYRWVDKDGGVVAIPIERAMELLVEQAGEETGP